MFCMTIYSMEIAFKRQKLSRTFYCSDISGFSVFMPRDPMLTDICVQEKTLPELIHFLSSGCNKSINDEWH